MMSRQPGHNPESFVPSHPRGRGRAKPRVRRDQQPYVSCGKQLFWAVVSGHRGYYIDSDGVQKVMVYAVYQPCTHRTGNCQVLTG